jgi:hypothetical protein
MVENGHKQALASAIAEARAEELQSLAEDLKQLDLFEAASVQEAQAPVVNGHRGPGRPLGSRNRRTAEASRFYMACKGDPLLFGVEISALPTFKTANEYVLSEKRFTNALLNMGFKPWETAADQAAWVLQYCATRIQ